MSKIITSNRRRFREIRKRPTKSLTIEGFLKSKETQNSGSFKQYSSSIDEFGLLLKKKFGLTVTEYIEELLIAAKDDDITNDVRDIKQSFWDYLGLIGRHCNVCNEQGKKMIRRNGREFYGRCYHCDGTKKKKRAASYGTRLNYMSRIDVFLRYFGIFNKIDEKNVKVIKGRKPKGKRKSLSKRLLLAIIDNTVKPRRKKFWQFLAQSGVRDTEGLKLKKCDFVFIDSNGEAINSEHGFDRIRVRIRAEDGNKMRVERDTFVHVELHDYVLDLLRKKGPNDYVFHDKSLKTAASDEVSAFVYTRNKMIKNGYVEMAEKKPEDTQYAITLHTLRSFFISKANRIDDSSFGDAIAGHDENMKAVYDRLGPKELLDLWKRTEPLLSLSADMDSLTDELEERCRVLTDEISNIKQENDIRMKKALDEQKRIFVQEIQQREAKLYDKIFKLMNDENNSDNQD